MVIIIKRPFYYSYSTENLLTISRKMNLAGNGPEVRISVVSLVPLVCFLPTKHHST